MATYRFYRTALIGTGTRQDPFRSALTKYIVNDGTQDFWSWAYDIANAQYCLAFTDSATHAAAAADPQITAIGPELADLAAISAWLDTPVGVLGQALSDIMEGDGFPVDWIGAGVTRRDLWRFITMYHVITQRFKGSGDNSYLAFFKSNLNATVSSLPVAQRNKVQAWMAAQGMDTSWITGATQLREVIIFVAKNSNLPVMTLGPVSF